MLAKKDYCRVCLYRYMSYIETKLHPLKCLNENHNNVAFIDILKIIEIGRGRISEYKDS
jgi:hypothetical protein